MGTAVAADAQLMEAGLDSLAAVELRNAIASHFDVSLPATVAFDNPTVAALASNVAHRLLQRSPVGMSSQSAAETMQLEANPAAEGPRLENVLATVQACVAEVLGANLGADDAFMQARSASLCLARSQLLTQACLAEPAGSQLLLLNFRLPMVHCKVCSATGSAADKAVPGAPALSSAPNLRCRVGWTRWEWRSCAMLWPSG